MGHQSYVLLCTETTLSNPPVVQPKSSCDVHLLRSPWLSAASTKQQMSESKLKNPPGQVASWCASDLTTQYTSMNKEFSLWRYWLWSFQGRDTKLEKKLHKNQHIQRKFWVLDQVENLEPDRQNRKNTLRTCFKYKNFLLNSCPKLSNQQLSFPVCQIY